MTPRRRLLLLSAVLVAALAAARADEPKKDAEVKLTPEEQTVLDLTNKQREKEKLPPLKLNPVLTQVARAHSQNMAKQEKMEHELDGKKPSQRVTDAGYDWATVGENIAATNGEGPDKVFERWMQSEHHKENILRDKYEEIGVGMAKSGKGEIYYTQVFASPRKKK